MNKAFKVLWNQVRGTYVVASEAQVTHGKPGKATKTIVAAAVAGLLAVGGSAYAATVDFSTVQEEGTTKFLSGNGTDTDIQTSANAWQMIQDLKAALNSDDKLTDIREAISQVDGERQTAILTGFSGGKSFFDAGTTGTLALVRRRQEVVQIRCRKVVQASFHGV